MGFLDRRPFDAGDPDSRTLLEALLALYDQAQIVRELIRTVGLQAAEFSWTAPMSQVWPEVLRKAADRGLLRRLVTAVADNPDTAAYEVITRLTAEPAGDAVPQSPRRQQSSEDSGHGSGASGADPWHVRTDEQQPRQQSWKT